MSQSQIYERLIEVMEQKYTHFCITDWQSLLLDIAAQAKKRPLVKIDNVPITVNEILTIQNIVGKEMQRLAFTLLCLAKYRNISNSNNNDWINYKYRDIFRMANVRATIKEQCLMIHDLKSLGLIRMNKIVDNLSINVCYVDKTDAEIAIHVKDFRNLGYEYQMYCGENFSHCEMCGIAMKQSKQRNRKFCESCAQLRIRQKK